MTRGDASIAAEYEVVSGGKVVVPVAAATACVPTIRFAAAVVTAPGCAALECCSAKSAALLNSGTPVGNRFGKPRVV